MQNKQAPNTYSLNQLLSADEKIELANSELEMLLAHFDSKASKGKRLFQLYKYASIILAAVTTIVASLQVIYAAQFPGWVLPVVSASATVAVAFLGASSAQKIWINSSRSAFTGREIFIQPAGRQVL